MLFFKTIFSSFEQTLYIAAVTVDRNGGNRAEEDQNRHTFGTCISDIEEKIKSVPEIKEGYDEIKESCLKLKEQNERLLEALRLGFESIPEAVKCGNARKIAILSELESSKESEK